MAIFVNELKEELDNIRTINLAKRTQHLAEKVFWLLISILGTVWFFYFMSFQFKMWSDNSTIKTKIKASLSDLDYPSITFCSKFANKYGVAKRFGNYLDPGADLDDPFLVWHRRNAIKCSIEQRVNTLIDENDLNPQMKEVIYHDMCITWTHSPSSCKVS